jgi:hypothetical protein
MGEFDLDPRTEGATGGSWLDHLESDGRGGVDLLEGPPGRNTMCWTATTCGNPCTSTCNIVSNNSCA